MRLLQSVLTRLKQTKKPQHKFVPLLLGLLLMLPRHATFRHMSRYSPDHERTCSRWYTRDFDWVARARHALGSLACQAERSAGLLARHERQ
jgi:hypothetical protein